MNPCRGFTLVEVLVVVLIIALGASLVAFSVGGDNVAAKLNDEAETFANMSALVLDEAVLSGQQWGIDLYRNSSGDVGEIGYRWLLRDEVVTDRWLPATPVGLDIAGGYFSAGVDGELTVEGTAKEIGPLLEPAAVTDDDEDKNGSAQNANDEREKLVPDILLLSSGEVSAFALILRREQDDQVYEEVVEADALGRFLLQSEKDNDTR